MSASTPNQPTTRSRAAFPISSEHFGATARFRNWFYGIVLVHSREAGHIHCPPAEARDVARDGIGTTSIAAQNYCVYTGVHCWVPEMHESTTHELTFCAEAAGWMNAELAARPELLFGDVRIEESAHGSTKRRDLSIYDRDGNIVVTGEVKFPWTAEGSSPFHEDLVTDAFSKAAKAGAEFFVTWNVNRLVLWRTDDKGKPLYERHIWETNLTQVRDPAGLRHPHVQNAIRAGLTRFLERASQAVTGELPLEKRPLDEFFLRVLEAALERPTQLVLAAITTRYEKERRFRQELDSWMRDVEGWQLSDDEVVKRDNLERAAKFSCYVLVNKIVFYNALRRRFPRLHSLRFRRNGKVQTHNAEALQRSLTGFFENAKRVTRDYETIFNGDFGDQLPFLSDAGVPAWVDLIRQIDQFDFTKINYDIIGPIFERLISPEERHRYGQHYTKPEIVDLINAFCVRRPDALVLDPACGGGTFLVRAYSRKKFLAERVGITLAHQDLIGQLFGVDISAYAAHLTMLNLATRDLIDERNYPLVAHDDFFQVEAHRPIFHLPFAKGAGNAQATTDAAIPTVDAVVGNPPYVRQEDISKPPTVHLKSKVKLKVRPAAQVKSEAEKYKKFLRDLVKREWPGIALSGRSDLHVYFWPHATKFLHDGGYYGFVTSSGWLDTEYGFGLQRFLLERFAVLAIFESAIEPWFTGARVATCATILRKESNPEKRAKNLVRFVQLRSPLSEVFPSAVSEVQRQQAVEALRDRIESITENADERHWRVRVIRQEVLERQGYYGSTEYRGSKWGIPLRAPDFFFELLDCYSDRLVPVSEVADIKRGITSGCDGFFFPRDITEQSLEQIPDDKEFRAKFGIHRYQTDKVRIVRAGDGSIHLIEADYLRPVIMSMMRQPLLRVDPMGLERCILVVSEPKSKLGGRRVLHYIAYGEREGHDKRPTCAGRDPWYNLAPGPPAPVLWPLAHQYRHMCFDNESGVIPNKRLFSIYPKPGIDPKAQCAILNSTIVALSKSQFGRWVGSEGNLDTEVIDVAMMLVPDPRLLTQRLESRLVDALTKMANRPVQNLHDEFDLSDRQELDDAVLELLGESEPNRRCDLRCRLYEEMTKMYRGIREKELLAIENKKRMQRQRRRSPTEIADETIRELDEGLLREFPMDFLDPTWAVQTIRLPRGQARLRAHALLDDHGIEVDAQHIDLGSSDRARFAKTLCDLGRFGDQPIPVDPQHCRTVLSTYSQYREQLRTDIADRVAGKTTDPKLQSRVLKILESRLCLH
jgi:type I restriction-modification system DNA methylase subunit